MRFHIYYAANILVAIRKCDRPTGSITGCTVLEDALLGGSIFTFDRPGAVWPILGKVPTVNVAR